MFTLPIAQPFHMLLWALLALGAALLILGFAFGQLDEERINRIPRPNKIASSVILVLCALTWWAAGAAGTPLVGYARLLFLGMLFSLLGDLIMAQLLPLPHYVLFGMGAFGVAHVLYISGYLRLGSVLGLQSGWARAGSLAVLFALAAVLWWTLIRAPKTAAVLNYGSLAYALLLAAMAGLAVSLAVQQPRFISLALGAMLFLVSDVLLGHRLFQGGKFLLADDLVWMTYIVGQAFIVFSTATALRLLQR